jgi:cyclic 2,3-diphosphoglycerate synthase
VIALIDGEHLPDVTRWALDVARDRGFEAVAALFVGGEEKLDPGEPLDLGVPVFGSAAGIAEALSRAIDDTHADAILDLSDEPVLGYSERFELACVALARGVRYVAADMSLEPPGADKLGVPSVAVFSTGKRAGKTAISGQLARVANSGGYEPVIVAMGRGGPAEPALVKAGSVDLTRLLELSRAGQHAASDYLEDAVMTGVATVGARRAGGGLAGAPFVTNMSQAARLAVEAGPGIVILEGSGAAVPPFSWDAGILVVPATAPLEQITGYLGPYRLLRSDLAVVTMGLDPTGSENLSAIRSHIRRFLGDARYLVTDFVPEPIADVRGERAFFATTAPRAVASRQVENLETVHGCTVVGWSERLADKAGFAEDLARAQEYDVLLTELKAGAVEIGAEQALARGAEVVFVDNRAVVIEGDAELDATLKGVLELARERGSS